MCGNLSNYVLNAPIMYGKLSMPPSCMETFQCPITTATIIRYVIEERVLEIEIEPGMKDGYNYPFIAEG